MKNSNLTKFLVLIFFLIGALDILGIISSERILRLLFKPLIIPSLMLVYWFSVKKPNKMYLAALFFAFLGDVLLLVKGNAYFLLGVSSFLLTHLIYISLLSKDIDTYKRKPLLLASIPFVATFVFMMLIIKENAEMLFLPLLVYGAVITLLGSLSFYNYLEKRDRTSLYMLIGIFLFIASDGVLAIERFNIKHRDLELGAIVMLTYVIAQYLICRFMIKKQKVSLKNI